ncbi:hypothetical protein BGX21_005636 [Mortierella sp. AD011]|nr:hypothetical protein BGX21_005636 [Mortierella sp. AD011]
MFFGFDRMEALFGHKPNTDPLYELDQSLDLGYGGQITNNADEDDDSNGGVGEVVRGGADENTDNICEGLTANDHGYLGNEFDDVVENNEELARENANTITTRNPEIEIASVTSSSLKRTASVSSSSSSRKAPPKLNTGQSREKGSFAAAYFDATEKKVDEWEKERYESERLERKREKKREARLQLMNTAINNGKSMEDVERLLALLEDYD